MINIMSELNRTFTNVHLLFFTEDFGIPHHMAQAMMKNWNLNFLILQLPSYNFIIDLEQLAKRYSTKNVGNSLK